MPSNRILFLLLILWVTHIYGHFAFSKYYGHNPLVHSIDIGKSGKINCNISIPMNQDYDVSFQFQRAGQNFEYLRSIVGESSYRNGELIPSGIPIPVHWSLKDQNGSILKEETLNTYGANGWSAAEVTRKVGEFKVNPGKYIFQFEVTGKVSEFEKVESNVEISFGSKSGTTWHSGYMFWGGVLNFLFGIPSIIFIITVLGYRLVKNLTSR